MQSSILVPVFVTALRVCTPQCCHKHYFTSMTVCIVISFRFNFLLIYYMGQCPAKSGLCSYNFITITKQQQWYNLFLSNFVHIYVFSHFGALIIIHGVSANIANPTG